MYDFVIIKSRPENGKHFPKHALDNSSIAENSVMLTKNKINIIHTDLHNRLQQNRSYLKLTILERMGGVYEIGLEITSCGMLSNFHEYWYGRSSIDKVLPQPFERLKCW
jgi:hypothetical protein